MAMGSLRTYVVTFNCGRELVNPKVFARNIFDALEEPRCPELLVLCFQEVAPIGYAFLGGSFLEPYFDSIRRTVETAAASLDGGSYVNIITRNVGMVAIMAFVLEEQAQKIRRIETAGVGVGVYEMGNKGAVALRLGYTSQEQEMELSVVAAHLAPMEKEVERRNEDWKNIARGLVFTPVEGEAVRQSAQQKRSQDDEDTAPLLSGSPDNFTTPSTGIYSAMSYLVLAGDLNYRTSGIKPSPVDYEVFPQPTQDATDSRHYSNLLKEDQLLREMKAQRTCHGLQEAPISFPPTYKYSDEARTCAQEDEGTQWLWARHRWPSWCDRILYLGSPSWLESQDPPVAMRTHKYMALPLMATSDHRPVALSLSIPLKSIPPPDGQINTNDVRLSPPFSTDPNWKQRRAAARRRELVVGTGTFLALTWEGRMALLGTLISLLGGWYIIGSLR